jgi:hypothetical protein
VSRRIFHNQNWVGYLTIVFVLAASLAFAQAPNPPAAANQSAPAPTLLDDERGRAERGQALIEKARQALGVANLQTLSVRARLQRFVKYVSVQSPTKVEEKEKVIGGKIELDFALPGQFRKRLASKTLYGWGYSYEEIINDGVAFRDPPLRVRSGGPEQRVIDVRDVERTLNFQTESVQQQVSIFTLLLMLQPPPGIKVNWIYLGGYQLDNQTVDVVLARNEMFSPFVLLHPQTGLPVALAFTFHEALRPTVTMDVATVDNYYRRRSWQRFQQEFRARSQPVKRHEMRWMLNDYRNVNGVQLPHVISILRDGEKLEELTFNEYKLNRPINANRFKGEAKVTY